MIIRVKNLNLKAIIGVNPWERVEKQSLIVNAQIEFDGQAAGHSDDLQDTIDYRTICQRIVDCVESSQFQLLEALTAKLLKIIMDDKRVTSARIEVDKPHALVGAESTSIELSACRT